MAEYIEREVFLKDIEERYCLPCEGAGKDFNGCKRRACWVSAMCGDVIDAPAADVAPVVHGHFVHDGSRIALGVDWWHCSNCGKLVSGVETRFNYCPNCGAKMDDGACNQVCKYNTPDRGCAAGELRARCDLANVAGERGNGEAG